MSQKEEFTMFIYPYRVFFYKSGMQIAGIPFSRAKKLAKKAWCDALYQGSLTVALGRLEINILIKVIIVLPFKNTKFHGLNSIPRCKFYFHTKSLLHLQRVYLD